MKQSIFEQECAVLTQKLEKVREGIEELQLQRESLPGLYRNQPELLAEMATQNRNRMTRMRQALEKPYFARIDFQSENAVEECYLGKIGIEDEHQRIVTVDWRAPIATLYYDSNLGRAAYEAPSGTIEGELLLKRQYDIEAGILKDYHDVEAVANDELLMPYLATGGDNRLKNIVSTIQKEQNRIIREKIGQNLIVQGAAGSGKTTVALHRIAYLVYKHRDEIRPSQYMVIGPNRFFISYIASVLPDLDVDSVPDHTFETLCGEYLGEDFTVENVSHGLARVMQDEESGHLERYKSSIAYKEALDRFFAGFLETVVPKKDLVFRGFTILTQEQIQETYATIDFRPNIPLQARVDQCILHLSTQIKNSLTLHCEQLDRYLMEEAQKDKTGAHLEKRRQDRETIRQELERGCRQILKRHFAVADTAILKLYGVFLSSCAQYMPDRAIDARQLKETTLQYLRQKVVNFADLPALIYLKLRMKGPGEYSKFRHAVVDEAQDLGEFHFYALDSLLSGSTFTIVGDLAQAIFGYRGISRWQDVKERALGGRADIVELRKSYRTTVEIMQVANRVVEALGLSAAEPVVRHGEPVNFIPCGPQGMVPAIERLISQYKQAGRRNIALICKTEEAVWQLGRALQEAGVAAVPITPESTGFGAGVCIIPSYLSKGLEFDAVILCDASQEVYRETNLTDMHLLYVAMTRALHRLDVLYDGALAAPLRSTPSHQEELS